MANKVSEQISSKLEELDEKQRYYIFGGILVFIFLINFFVLMQPQLNSLSKINPEIKTLKTDLKNVNNNLARLAQYRKEVDNLRINMDEVNEKVRKRGEVPIILEKISVIAEKNNIKINQIVPNPESEEVILENNERRYFDLPVTIKAKGNYHDFGRFINDIENNNEAFIKIGTFTIQNKNDSSKSHDINVVLMAMVYEKVKKK